MPSINMDDSSNGRPVSEHDDSKYVAHDIIMKFTVSMSLKAALELGIPDILFKAQGGKPLTADEILAQLPVKSRQPDSDLSRRLGCLLKPLVWEGFFTECFNDSNQPAFGLTKLSKWFINENKLSMLSLAELAFNEEIMGACGCIKNSILDDAVNPLESRLGMSAYVYALKHPEFSSVYQNPIGFRNMEIHSVIDNLQRSGVLKGVETLVDVAGGAGSFVAEIVVKNPQIKGINFDRPGVVALVPEVKGVTGIGGNMFEAVPSGDAMFVKSVVHNYGDKDAIVMLKNCFKALPKQGKAIIVEYVLVDDTDRSPKSKMAMCLDFLMLVFMKGARERTSAEYKKIIAAAGFARSEFIPYSGSMDFIVAYKE